MVINDFHIFCSCIRPTKADTPLVVDTDTVLTGTITLEGFKMITGWHHQIAKSTSDLELPEFTPCNLSNMRELPDTLAF